MLAGRAGLEPSVVDALAHAYERWDGKGYPAGLEGDEIPLAVRVVAVARDADLATMLGDDPGEWMGERTGRAYDPRWSKPSSGWDPTCASISTKQTSGRPPWRPSRNR